MENFIFILIGVIWLVYSVSKANQKKNTASTSATENSQEAKNRGFEDIMAEILGTSNVRQHIPDQYIETLEEEAVEEEVGNAYQSLEDLYLKEELENQQEPYIEEPKKDNLEPQITKRNSRKQQFDLRTAIIYQAILERPHA
ncbi:MAG: hypothetical protein RBR87_02295 [Bacteroidales bacterium]|jgi:hypothetical protein|nr:hypothetical protein [Bacteroidales bacterium]